MRVVSNFEVSVVNHKVSSKCVSALESCPQHTLLFKVRVLIIVFVLPVRVFRVLREREQLPVSNVSCRIVVVVRVYLVYQIVCIGRHGRRSSRLIILQNIHCGHCRT